MIETLKIAGQDVVIDPKQLEFNETTLSNYIQTEGGYYDNFGAFLALAEKVQQFREMEYDAIYNERLVEAKEQGATDKISEAKAKANEDVLEAKKLVIDSRYNVRRLQQHLRAWDKNHDNAQSMGHMIRKEIDKLGFEIRGHEDFKNLLMERRIDSVSSIDKQLEEQTNSSKLEELDMDDLRSIIG